jgi:hypothetical protein
MASKAKLFILINVLSVIRVSLLETVHFTNSPNKIRTATNYTTYKVEVPNGDPITIIEANQPLIDKRIKFDDAESAGKYSAHRNGDRRKQVMELESTLSMTVTPNRNYEYENSAAAVASAGDEESVTSNDYSNLSHERDHKRNTMLKTVYSPELLTKFLKDYANKINGEGSIEGAASSQQQQQHHHQHLSVELGQPMENDKYASVETGDDDDDQNINNNAANEDGNRRVSNTSGDEEKDSNELNDIQQRKNYRPNGNYNGNHPYNKNNGWVTLDAVPWSKSKVSKWQSNVKRYGQQPQGNYNYQNGNNYGPPPRPSSSHRPSSGGSSNNYDYDYNGGNNDNDDYYSSSRPSRPTFHNNQFYGSGYQQSSRPPPPPPPQDNFYQSSHHHSSSSHHHHNGGGGSNEYEHRPPSNNRPEIITDNRPSNFPSHNEEHQRPSYGQRPNYQHQENSYHGGNYHSYKEGPPPQTYPHNGKIYLYFN